MGVGGQLAYLYTSYRASRIRHLAGYLPHTISIRGYCQASENTANTGHGVEERAPTTAEEFERVAEAKIRQGVGSQTVEKAEDGFQEGTGGEAKVESVKERYKEHAEKGDYHKSGDDSEVLTPK